MAGKYDGVYGLRLGGLINYVRSIWIVLTFSLHLC